MNAQLIISIRTYSLLFILLILAGCKTSQAVVTEAATPRLDTELYALIGNYKLLEVDKLGFIYLVTVEKNEILKLTADYEILFRFSLRGFGDIHQLFVDNPQKLMVYYSDYNKIIFLDNTLSEINRLDLESLSLWNMQGATLARNNIIWLLDSANIRLLTIAETGKILLSTNEQDPVLREYISEVPYMINKNNLIYINNGKKIAIYDEFGVHMKSYEHNNQGIQLHNKQILFLEDKQLMSIDTDLVRLSNSAQRLAELKGPAIDFYLRGRSLYWIDSYGLVVQNL